MAPQDFANFFSVFMAGKQRNLAKTDTRFHISRAYRAKSPEMSRFRLKRMWHVPQIYAKNNCSYIFITTSIVSKFAENLTIQQSALHI